MSREVRRVPVDFDWPIGEVWSGYRLPANLRLPPCPSCDGRGYSAYAQRLFDRWYGFVPFTPESNGSTPLTPETPAVRAFAERNVSRSPEYYGTGEFAIHREAVRLATMWNGMWMHHVNADDVAALVDRGRLHDFTHTRVKGAGWIPKKPAVVPTPEQVNAWSILGPLGGHDSINASIVVQARCRRDRQVLLCRRCKGTANIGSKAQRAEQKAWTPTKPPTGDGWQLWETVSEGSPQSPVFTTGEDLARWMVAHAHKLGPGNHNISLDIAKAWVFGPGWTPSGVMRDGETVSSIELMVGGEPRG